MRSHQKQVTAGMKLLDEKYPGWERFIDLKTLHLSDCASCILGQLYGEYSRGARLVVGHSGPFENIPYGFEAEWINEKIHRDYAGLTKEWELQIRQRLKSAAKRLKTIKE